MEKVEITIIGAGVVGLSVASHLSESGKNVVLLEKYDSFGQECSSRNSEVIHASIYYPPGFLKGKLCLEGNELMYDYCSKNKIPHSNTKKLIIAVTDKEVDQLPVLLETAKNNGAKGVRIINKNEIAKIEPNVKAKSAIYCPTSGIVDSHRLMQYYEANAIHHGTDILYKNEVVGIERKTDSYKLTVSDDEGKHYEFETDIMINCAGLGSGHISELAGIDINKFDYRIHYAKGMYFRVTKQLERYPKMLIYPLPPEDNMVGIHTVPDLYGGMRLGPYDVPVDKIEYSVDESLRGYFYNFVRNYLPFLKPEDIQPDMAGIHPKTQKPGEPMQDFVIRHEIDKGLPNFINLVGIESPGLTSSPAIGRYVTKMVNEL
ncbi:NAD(P)/FAD-dependent oxidoreductase [Bacteroidota bacterium]